MAESGEVSLAFLRKQLEDAQRLKSGGGDGTSNDMEPRVAALENEMREVRSDLKAIRVDLSEIKGKISNMPSTWQMIGVFAALIALLLAGSGVLFGIIRYLGI